MTIVDYPATREEYVQLGYVIISQVTRDGKTIYPGGIVLAYDKGLHRVVDILQKEDSYIIAYTPITKTDFTPLKNPSKSICLCDILYCTSVDRADIEAMITKDIDALIATRTKVLTLFDS